MSRNTIRKYLRAGTVEPKFKVPERASKLDPFAEKLSAWLRIETGRSRKQRRTARQMHADLVVLGYDGSYNRVAAFVRTWKPEQGYWATAELPHIEELRPSLIATANTGCAMQIEERTAIPVVHFVELLDWAMGGNPPVSFAKVGHVD